MKIPRINHNKIKEGQQIFKNGLYDSRGRYLGKAPITYKKFPIVEFKVLPDSLSRALESNDDAVRNSYQQWVKRELPDW